MNQQQVQEEFLNVTQAVNARYYFTTPAQAALRPSDRPEAPGWHGVVTVDDGGVEFHRKFILTPTNPLAIMGGLNGPILGPQNYDKLVELLRDSEKKLRYDVAFWRVMQKEK
jgi:hypothetical protein